jgi:hypothetical protein
MSLVEELAARLRASSDTLPLDEVAAALHRLRASVDLLMRVRAESHRPVGVPQLAAVVEHLEHAGWALRVAQDAIDDYLAVVGVGLPGRPVTGLPPNTTEDPGDAGDASDSAPMTTVRGTATHWWSLRVAELTGGDGAASADEPGGVRVGEPAQLLGRVARLTAAGERDGLYRELTAVSPPVGLALASVSPPRAHRLAGQLLGHPPRPADLAVLAGAVRGPVGAMLPGLPGGVLDVLLARVCRVPRPAGSSGTPVHPVDSAVAGAVMVGALMGRLGGDPDDREADRDPVERTGGDDDRRVAADA